MSNVSDLLATDQTFREVADLLFGDGATELIAKMNPDGADLSTSAKKKKAERTQAQIGLASNVVGIGAGAAGTAAAYEQFKNARGKFIPKHRGKGKIAAKLTPKNAAIGAGAALGLQATNLAGDAVANRVLARSAKKDEKVKKNYRLVAKSAAEIKENASFPKKTDLTVATVTSAARAGGKGAEYVKAHGGQLKKLPEKVKAKVQKSDEVEVRWEGEFSKVNLDKQQIFGWASIVEIDGEPVVDLQGDYIAIDEVEKSAYEYVHKSRKGGDMHLRDGVEPVVKSHMIESFVVTPEKKAALGLPEETPVGWWVGYQVNDPELWGKVKSGERTGFSIHGRGVRTPA